MPRSIDNPVQRRLVLLVEGDDHTTRIYRSALCRRGLDVIAARTMAQARTVVLACRPDVVVVDTCLPDGDGLLLVRHWRETIRMQSVPILVLTARLGRAEMGEALCAGASLFVAKPFFGEALASHVTSLFAVAPAPARVS